MPIESPAARREALSSEPWLCASIVQLAGSKQATADCRLRAS